MMVDKADKTGDVLQKLSAGFKLVGEEAEVRGLVLHTKVGDFLLGEAYGKRKGTWMLSSAKFGAINKTAIYCPRTHVECDKDAINSIRYLLNEEKKYLAFLEEQLRKRTLVADVNEMLANCSVHFEPDKYFKDHMNPNAIGERGTFTLHVPIERVVEVTTKFAQLAAELGFTVPTSS
jgi:hypothetical protein